MISLAPAVAKDGKPIAPCSHNIFAVASGKGGVGKTFFSITLTHAIARMGLHPVLFDGDLGLANVDVQLGLMPPRDLGGVIAGRLTLNQARLPYPPGGFDIIAGRSGAGALAALPPSRLALLSHDLAELAQGLDYIVIDLGAGIDRMVRQFANVAGHKLVVATTEPTSLTDAYAFMKIILQDNPKSDLQIVINQARSLADGKKTYLTLLKACETFLKISPPLAGIIRRDHRVIETIRMQASLLTKFPGSDAAQDIQNIAQRLTAR